MSNNVQLMKDEQGMVLNVTNGVIRLQSFDAFRSSGADALYLSARTRWIFAGFPQYRKFQVISGLFGVIGDNELPDQMVKRRPELMDDFSNNDAESWGKFTTGNN